MAEAITDAHVTSVLKVVVRGSGPVLDALTRTDPFGWKRRTHAMQRLRQDPINLRDKAVRRVVRAFADTEYPGTAAWEQMTVSQRSQWWVDRVGRFTTLVVSVPGLGGVVADRFPVQSTLGAASQAMVLCAVAREHGLTDDVDQVRLLAHVLSRRSLSRDLVTGTAERSPSQLDSDGVRAEPAGGRMPLVVAVRALWRYGRVLRSILGELDKRPQGRWVHRALGKLPVVGLAGDYLGERSALKRAVRQGEEWIRTHRDTLGVATALG